MEREALAALVIVYFPVLNSEFGPFNIYYF
jgi:hypothetical protein